MFRTVKRTSHNYRPSLAGRHPASSRALPLRGITVLDLTRILSGPFCTMKLGDMGAEVIKVEQPGTGDETRRWGPPFIKGESAYFLSVNRNKKSVTLDLKSEEGKRILTKLIKRSDVLVENFRAGVMRKLGFGHAGARRINPRLIYCSISGYGQTSSRSHRPSYDLIVQGESGLMDLTGFPDGPPTKAGISLADVNAGNIAFEGILLALLQRERTGKGQHVDISLLDSLASLFAYQSQIAMLPGNSVRRKGNRHPTITPYETYQTGDGYINVAVAGEAAWKNFCVVIGHLRLASDRRFLANADRVTNRGALERILIPIMKRKRSSDWLRRFAAADVPAGRINTVQEALGLGTMRERKMIVAVKHATAGTLKMVGNPIKLSSAAQMFAPPLLGEHTHEILRRLGYPAAEIRRLRKFHVI
jgi:crotonobetainyl-CoA:carnitine CoA-transferase CaiB-like acyl-CoA transferase